MLKRCLAAFALPLAVSLGACGSATPAEPAPTETGTPAEAAAVAEGGTAWSVDLYRRLAGRPGNLFVSPVSVSTAFGLVIAGARGPTAAEIARTLHYPAQDARLHPGMAALAVALRREREGERLTIANALWVQNGFTLSPDYLDLTRRYYGAAPTELDFGQPAQAVGRINRWAEERTNGLIRNLLSPDQVGAATRSVLTNAVYFNGDWARPFESERTVPAPFHAPGGDTPPVPFMSQLAGFRYFEEAGFQAIDLDYRGEELAMAIFLPRAPDGLAALEQGLDAARLRSWLDRLTTAEPQQVALMLPKLRMEQRYLLRGELEALGMRLAFSPQADFSGMSAQPLMIDEVVHQTFLRVDEEGTEAAAATAVTMEVTARRMETQPTVFRADHPFLFLIRHKPTGAIVFIGRVERP